MLGALALLFCGANQARAQRAGDNAAAAAADAFGTTVGNESLGLYGSFDARGFSPVRAGNVRIEGLYFDQQAQLNSRLSSGNAVRVGISAQAYPFPAPTGISDVSLRLPGDKPVTSVFVGYGAYETFNLEVDSQQPLVTDKLSVGLGGRAARFSTDTNTKFAKVEAGALMRWRAEDAEVVGFWGGSMDSCCRQQPAIFTAGAYLPPPIERRHYWGQSWTKHAGTDQTFGILGRTLVWDNWTIRLGLFHALNNNNRTFGDFVSDVQPNGSGDHTIIASPQQASGSSSGELRLARVITDGDFRHSINIALRARNVQRYYGGGQELDLGTAFIGRQVSLPEPPLTYGPTTHDHTQQATGGVAYDVTWLGVADLGAGLQKTIYHRDIFRPGVPAVASSSSPLLYNATLSVFVSKSLALYGSYTKGLEESGIAPESTLNRGAAMPASITKQVDGGFRYVITPNLKLIAGLFQVEKPYFNINTANIYGALGSVRHRGAEFSLAGKIGDSVSVVGGLIFIQPRLSGEPVDRGVVGPKPPGPRPRFGLLSITYQPPSWGGFALDSQLNNASGKTAHSDNLISTHGWTEVSLGARYRFKLWDTSASLRAQVQNITNHFVWDVDSGGAFFPRSPRRFSANLAVDF